MSISKIKYILAFISILIIGYTGYQTYNDYKQYVKISKEKEQKFGGFQEVSEEFYTRKLYENIFGLDIDIARIVFKKIYIIGKQNIDFNKTLQILSYDLEKKLKERIIELGKEFNEFKKSGKLNDNLLALLLLKRKRAFSKEGRIYIDSELEYWLYNNIFGQKDKKENLNIVNKAVMNLLGEQEMHRDNKGRYIGSFSLLNDIYSYCVENNIDGKKCFEDFKVKQLLLSKGDYKKLLESGYDFVEVYNKLYKEDKKRNKIKLGLEKIKKYLFNKIPERYNKDFYKKGYLKLNCFRAKVFLSELDKLSEGLYDSIVNNLVGENKVNLVCVFTYKKEKSIDYIKGINTYFYIGKKINQKNDQDLLVLYNIEKFNKIINQ